MLVQFWTEEIEPIGLYTCIVKKLSWLSKQKINVFYLMI